MSEDLGIFLGPEFCLHSIIPVIYKPEYPPWDQKQQLTKAKAYLQVHLSMCTLFIPFRTSFVSSAKRTTENKIQFNSIQFNKEHLATSPHCYFEFGFDKVTHSAEDTLQQISCPLLFESVKYIKNNTIQVTQLNLGRMEKI